MKYPSNLKKLCNQIVKTGRQKLNLTMGIVSHIANDRYEIVAVSSQTDVFVAGEDFELKDTYCRDVYNTSKTIALTEIDNCPGLQRHPLYEVLALEQNIPKLSLKERCGERLIIVR